MAQKPKQVAKPMDQTDYDYLAARRVRSQHSWFMREVVDPLIKENPYAK